MIKEFKSDMPYTSVMSKFIKDCKVEMRKANIFVLVTMLAQFIIVPMLIATFITTYHTEYFIITYFFAVLSVICFISLFENYNNCYKTRQYYKYLINNKDEDLILLELQDNLANDMLLAYLINHAWQLTGNLITDAATGGKRVEITYTVNGEPEVFTVYPQLCNVPTNYSGNYCLEVKQGNLYLQPLGSD